MTKNTGSIATRSNRLIVWFIQRKSQGFTLIELALALAIGAVVLSGAVLTIFQVLVTTDKANQKVVALTDIDRAVLSIKNDLMMAQVTNLNNVAKNSASMNWTDYTSFGSTNQTNHNVSYNLSGKQLHRTYDGVNETVGRNVTAISFTQSGKLVTVTISTSNSTSLRQVETLTFSSHIRAEELQ